MISLIVNLLFKIILPLVTGDKLSRANEMLLGVLLPSAMLLGYELYAMYKQKTSSEYIEFQKSRIKRREEALEITEQEALLIMKQNKFGLKVISFSLFFIFILLAKLFNKLP